MVLPGIYIKIYNNDVIRISFKELHKLKELVDQYYVEDIEYIDIVALSTDNAQPVYLRFVQEELEGFEVCYRAVKILFGAFEHYVVVYVPGKYETCHYIFNTSNRLIAKPLQLPPRKKLFYLKRKP